MLNKLSKFVNQDEMKEKILDILDLEDADNVIQAKLKKVLSTMTVLDLSDKELDDQDVWHLAFALEVNKTIHTVNLSNNDIYDGGAECLAIVIKNNNSIYNLNLSNNNIGDEGAKYIAEALKKNKTIQNIELSGNDIQDVGVMAFSKALMTNQTLQSLLLSADEQFKQDLEKNKEIQKLMQELVEINFNLPEPRENIVDIVNNRSMSMYYRNFFSFAGFCQNIHQNNTKAPLSGCPAEILYMISEMYNKSEFQAKYDQIPIFCRQTIMHAIKDIKEEISR